MSRGFLTCSDNTVEYECVKTGFKRLEHVISAEMIRGMNLLDGNLWPQRVMPNGKGLP